jgi:hypothetical protein
VGPGYTELLENEEVYKTGAGGEVYKDVDEGNYRRYYKP